MTELLGWGAAATALSLVAVRQMIRYATSRRILDVPNERSSHARVTPRGGGAGIVTAVCVLVAAAWLLGRVPHALAIALLGGGLLVAAVGWIDDNRGMSAAVRAVAHCLAAIWAVVWLGGLPLVSLGAQEIRFGTAGTVLAVIGIVWTTNLFNFMDGIDGIAGGEGASVGLAAAVLLYPRVPAIALVFIVIAGSCLGFLRWNWMPARIFMGDVGSGFLGFALGVLAVAAQNAGAMSIVLFSVLFGVFVLDTTATLLRRVAAREKWYGAHRSHAYQRAVQAGASHAAVSSAVVLLNLVLAAATAVALRRPGSSGWAVAFAFLVLASVYAAVEIVEPMRRRSSRVGQS